jgi:soluble lytic murein transglycosylase-like protein
MRFLGIFLFVAGSVAWGGEFVTFASGSYLHIDRHEAVDAGKFRLYAGDGYTEIAASQVLRFEPDGEVSAAVAAKATPSATAPGATSARELADQAADKYGLPRNLVRSVMAAESGFATQAVSPKGAIGLMQLMPSTARDLGVNAQDPAQNVDAGARYLRDLLIKYNGALWHALAAYNAGPEAVDKYNGIPPYLETIRYVYRIDKDLKSASKQ